MLDNLNTHFRKSFDDALGRRAAAKPLRRVQFHDTPKHASWLSMAEIEIGILSPPVWVAIRARRAARLVIESGHPGNTVSTRCWPASHPKTCTARRISAPPLARKPSDGVPAVRQSLRNWRTPSGAPFNPYVCSKSGLSCDEQ